MTSKNLFLWLFVRSEES